MPRAGQINRRDVPDECARSDGTVGDITLSVSGLGVRRPKSVVTIRSTEKMGQARRRLGRAIATSGGAVRGGS